MIIIIAVGPGTLFFLFFPPKFSLGQLPPTSQLSHIMWRLPTQKGDMLPPRHMKRVNHAILNCCSFCVTEQRNTLGWSVFNIHKLTVTRALFVSQWWIRVSEFAITPTQRAQPVPLSWTPGRRWLWHHQKDWLIWRSLVSPNWTPPRSDQPKET